MYRADSVFTATTGVAQHKRCNRFRRTILTPIRPPASKIPALVPTKGGEIGVRTVAVPHLQSTLSLWYLRSASELQQDGDTGGTVPSASPSNRYGVEWANYYTPLEHLALDFDLADSKALFTTIDADDAAPNSPGGKRVPEAVGFVTSAGITLHDYKGLSAKFAPAQIWAARFDIRRNLSLKSNNISQSGGRLSN